MRGDLLFWPAGNSLPDRVIAWFTRGPFTHVSVDIGNDCDVGAHSENGVQAHRIPSDVQFSAYHPDVPPDAVERGMVFLRAQIGKKYGFLNILNAILARINVPWRIYHVNRYDCSSLVAHYLEHVGIDLSDDDEAISPNDLARGLGLLK